MTTFVERYGPWAVVTGAAEGLGACFAGALAARGLDLVLLDQKGDLAAQRADALETAHGVQTRAVEVDLARPDLMDVVGPATEDLEVGLLVNNAALVPVGSFFDQDLDLKLRQLDVNSRAALILTHTLGRPMVARGGGGVILVSSMSAYQGVPLVATYAATKAFNMVLGEGLWAELRGSGVDPLVVAPGVTDTPGYRTSGPDTKSFAGSMVMPAEQVVEEALAALGRTPLLVPGHRNRLSTLLISRLLPRRLAMALVGRSTRALYPDRG